MVGLTFSFDASVRAGDVTLPGTMLFWSPRVLRFLIAAGVVFAVLALWRLTDILRCAQSTRAVVYWTIAHVLAFGAFVFSTWRVLSRGSEIGPADFALWLATSVMTVGLWAAAMVAPRKWLRLLVQGWDLVLLALAAGLATSLLGSAFQQGWDILSEPTLRAAYGILSQISDGVWMEPNTRQLGTSRFWVEIAPACSGYEGMGLVAAYLSGYLWLFRRDLLFPRAFTLLPLGIVAIWVANVARIVVLVMVGDRISPTLALGGFHSQAGWLAFNAIALGLAVLAHRSRLFAKYGQSPPARNTATVAYLTPLLALVAIQLISGLFTSDPAALNPVRVGVAAILLWLFRTQYRLGGLGNQLHDFAWAAMLGTTMFFGYVILAPETSANEGGIRTGTSMAAVAIHVIGFVVITPIAEVLAFRGYLMRRLIDADFERVPYARVTWSSVLISSRFFGLVPTNPWAGLAAGMGYALVACVTGRLWPAVLAHAFTNSLLIAASMEPI
jgi:exosortase E/protease (VPEID-CTERM system)